MAPGRSTRRPDVRALFDHAQERASLACDPAVHIRTRSRRVGVDQPPDFLRPLFQGGTAMFSARWPLGASTRGRDPRGVKTLEASLFFEVEQRDQRDPVSQGRQATERTPLPNVRRWSMDERRASARESRPLACCITGQGLRAARSRRWSRETDRHRAVAGFALRTNQEFASSRAKVAHVRAAV